MRPRPARPSAVALLLASALIRSACSIPPPPPPSKPLRTASVNYDGTALKLAEAVDRRDAATVRRLIHDQGIDPDTVFSDHGLPIVAWPVLNRNPEGLRLLLDNGADPNSRRSRPDGRPINNAMIYAA